jgi:hypothetical protein
VRLPGASKSWAARCQPGRSHCAPTPPGSSCLIRGSRSTCRLARRSPAPFENYLGFTSGITYLANYGLFYLEADLRWIDMTAARLDALAREVRK